MPVVRRCLELCFIADRVYYGKIKKILFYLEFLILRSYNGANKLEFLILRSYNGANKFDYGDEIMIQVFSKATSYQRYL